MLGVVVRGFSLTSRVGLRDARMQIVHTLSPPLSLFNLLLRSTLLSLPLSSNFFPCAHLLQWGEITTLVRYANSSAIAREASTPKAALAVASRQTEAQPIQTESHFETHRQNSVG